MKNFIGQQYLRFLCSIGNMSRNSRPLVMQAYQVSEYFFLDFFSGVFILKYRRNIFSGVQPIEDLFGG